MPKVIVIAALASSDRAIGSHGKLPWSIPEDLKRFQRLTLHHTVIVGRKTWEFDLKKRPLKNRSMIVVSTSLNEDTTLGIDVARSLEAALEKCRDRDLVFIAGGASLYAQGLTIADQLELTLVEGHYEADVFFPPFQHLIGTVFKLVRVEPRLAAQNGDGLTYRFETYERVSD
ncbi:dihydrofolate reductase [Myxacorys almedinensis]|uniref:dihydrofolate reductase n=1 Tax=Myxacorys almedinensis A TaxID=2690445 RepID=A0A8J8CNE5_9CYAN|nr:dihydrofolate reductase [Myxacorys almedinensis]NDJ19490.1 dihydrofolate reductase [Myxacorys almedinensis A]